jgi:serine/threonine-protein kinase
MFLSFAFPAGICAQQDLCWLDVQGNQPSARVLIDGNYVGDTDASGRWLGQYAAGVHTVQVRYPGMEDWVQVLTLRESLLNRVDYELVPAQGGDGDSSADPFLVAGSALMAVMVVVVGFVLWWEVLGGKESQGQRRQRVGPYTVKREIASGGMATIYLAKKTGEKRPVAIKMMNEGLMADADLVRKFIREAEILGKLNELDPEAPIVEVFDSGTVPRNGFQIPYMVLEYIDGQNLLQHLRSRGRLPLQEAAIICAGVARALIPAHSIGVYHRDLDPQNVMLCTTLKGGFPLRLIDFGVARHEFTSHATLDGGVAGKPPYMSPEQCRNEKVDGRSDIYSLGIILYTLLVGRPPFQSKNPLEVMSMHQKAPIEYPPEIPPAGVVLLEKMLAKKREERLASVSQVYEKLMMLANG